MPNIRAQLVALALVPLVAACGGAGAVQGGGKVQSTGSAAAAAPAARPVVRQPARAAQRPAQVHMVPGLEGVIGATPSEVTRRFGQARLDVWEGDARKLQFSGAACVLDIYFYPEHGNREPVATYTEARRASDGKDVDRAACVAALRSSSPGR